jgi:hypothetical protein
MSRDARAALLLALAALVLYLANARLHTTADLTVHTLTAASWIREGDAGLDEYAARAFFSSGREVSGHFVSWYPPGAAVLASLPLAALLAAGARPETELFLALFGKVLGALAAAASVAFVYLACRSVAGRDASLVAALAYAFGTSTWSITSQQLWQHAPAQLWIAAGTFLLARGGVGAARAGLAFGLGVVARLTDAAVALAAVLAMPRGDRLRYFAWALPAAAFLATYQWLVVGTPFAAGYPSEPWFARLDGYAGLLLSPSRGLFVYSPFLVLALVSWQRAWRGRGEHRALLRATSLGALGVWLIHGSFGEWWGGWNFGNRYLLDTLPAFAVAIAIAIESGALAALRAKVAFGLALGWSAALQLAGAAYYYEFWDGRHWDVTPVLLDVNLWRLWDWADPQWLFVLRHLVAAPDAALALSLGGVVVAALLVQLARAGSLRPSPRVHFDRAVERGGAA